VKRITIALALLILGGVLGGLFFDGLLVDSIPRRPFPTFTIIFSAVSVLIAYRIYSDIKEGEN
jgi:hypothetical protein